MKKILIIGAGSIQLPVIKKAKDLGFYTISVDFDSKAKGANLSDEFHLISTNDTDKILELSKNKLIDGILTTSDYPVNTVAYVSNQLGLPGMSIELARICTNKYFQREFFKHHEIKSPRYQLIESLDDLNHIDFFPCVIKPVDSSASRGVKRVNNMEELLEQYPISKKYAKSGSIIVEEFISGREFSVETLSQNNKTHIIQITEKLVLGEQLGYFVEDTHIQPARLSSLEIELIQNQILEVASKINLNNCPAHIELKLNTKGVFIIEMACRLGGDYITSDLVPLSTGVDMLDNLIRISVGEKINIIKTKAESSCIQFLNYDNYNRCNEFIKKGNKYIIRSETYEYNQNQIMNSNDRLGYIIISTPSLGQTEELLKLIK